MENSKAIEIFNKLMDCKDAYQADPSCDGNCLSCEYYASAEEEKEAMVLAIAALEKQIPKRKLEKSPYNENLFGLRCPSCGERVGNYNGRLNTFSHMALINYCPKCGQAIDFSKPQREEQDG